MIQNVGFDLLLPQQYFSLWTVWNRCGDWVPITDHVLLSENTIRLSFDILLLSLRTCFRQRTLTWHSVTEWDRPAHPLTMIAFLANGNSIRESAVTELCSIVLYCGDWNVRAFRTWFARTRVELLDVLPSQPFTIVIDQWAKKIWPHA